MDSPSEDQGNLAAILICLPFTMTAVAHPVVSEDVAVVPELLNDMIR